LQDFKYFKSSLPPVNIKQGCQLLFSIGCSSGASITNQKAVMQALSIIDYTAEPSGGALH